MDERDATREMLRAELLNEIASDAALTPNQRAHARKLLGELGKQLSMDRALGLGDHAPDRQRPKLDRNRIWPHIVREKDAMFKAAVMKFATWVFDGEKDMDATEAIVIDLLKRRPANPYAYYAPEREARSHIAEKARGDRMERESKATKRSEIPRA